MADFDFAIAGTSLFSGLLAGVLARDHGRKVVRVGRRPSAQRLWRSLPVALPFSVRPESWRILRRSERETVDLLNQIGVRAAASALEASIIADVPQSGEALDHLAHLAAGHGHEVRPHAAGWNLRRVLTLDADAIAGPLEQWLTAAGVASLEEGPVDAAMTILADDVAVLAALDEASRPAPIATQAVTATLVVSPRSPTVPLQRFVDRGVTLFARPGNTILAFVLGETDIEARLASTLPGPFPMKRLATTRFRRAISLDGAPVIGRVRRTRQLVVAGFGDSSPFMAPAVGRWLADVPDDADRAWFARHSPTRMRAPVADFVAKGELSP